MAPKAGERFSWRVVKTKGLLGQADVERLAGIALLHLDQLHIDKDAAARELGNKTGKAFNTALFEIKKKCREGGALLSVDGEPEGATTDVGIESAAEPMTPKKRPAKKKLEDATPAKKKSETGQAKSKRGKGRTKVMKEEEVEERVVDTEWEAEEEE